MSSSRHTRVNLRWWWLLLLLVAAAAAYAACVERPAPAETAGTQAEDGVKMKTSNATVDDRQNSEVVCARATIGAEGGTLMVAGTGTPADGLTAAVPPGALAEEEELSLGYSRRKVKIRAGTGSGIVLFIRTERAREFAQPVMLGIRLDSSLFTGLAIPYQVDDDGRLHVMDIRSIDEEKLRLTFSTFKPCAFTWVYP